MKTIRDHIESLPEPYRSEALEAMEEQGNQDLITSKQPNISASLYVAFLWSKTKKVYNYWATFISSLTTTL